jgi:acetone carboxylase gamma subunit
MTTYEDGLKVLDHFMEENGIGTDGTEDDRFQAALNNSLKFVEQGKDLDDNYGRLLTVALYTVNTLDKMITRCQNEGALEEFKNYHRLVNSFSYRTDDVMGSYEKLRDIYEKLLFSSTYFGFCDYLVDAGPVKPSQT